MNRLARSLSTVAGASVLAGAVLVATPATAAPPVITCPQSVAVVGFPLDPSPLVPAGAVLTVNIGPLPDGLSLISGNRFLSGEPTRVQSSTFTLHASVTNPDLSVETAVKTCTVTVKKRPEVRGISGVDRYAQAVSVSTLKFSEADTVYIASGQKYPDALSAGAMAAAHDAPLLLTQAGSVPGVVLDEIQRLAPDDIVIVGGEASVSAAAAASIDARSAASITRVGGRDRYEVSRALIAHTEFGIGAGGSEKAFVVTGRSFPDALTATPAAASVGGPVLLVDGQATALAPADRELLDFLGVADVAIAGGTASVSAALEASIAADYDTVRHAGADRYEAGVAVNRASFAEAKSLYLASGTAFADSLSGGVVAGIEKSPLYVTQSGCLPHGVFDEIGRVAPDVVYTLGGPATLGAGESSLTPCGLD